MHNEGASLVAQLHVNFIEVFNLSKDSFSIITWMRNAKLW